MLSNLSVVIPIRNMETELNTLLEEIKYLILKNAEVIIIDDGSVDRTLKILHEFKNQDKILESLIILSQSHEGPGAARNLGLTLASKELLVFWDSDDVRFMNNFEALIDIGFIEDLLVAEYILKSNLKSRKFFYVNKKQNLSNLVSNGGLWRIVFKRNFVLNLKFPNLFCGEDLVFLAKVVSLNPRILWSDTVIYEYNNNRSDQISRIKYYKLNSIKSCFLLMDELKKSSVHNKNYLGVILIKLVSTSIRSAKFKHSKLLVAYLCRSSPIHKIRIIVNLIKGVLILMTSKR